MDFSLTDEQAMLRDTVSRYLASSDPLDARLKRRPAAPVGDAPLWRALATDLGILGASLPERVGGLGGGAVETMVIMEALGEALAVTPYLSNVVLAGQLLTRAGGERADALLAGIADGSMQVALAALEADARHAYHAVAATARAQGNGWVIDGAKAVVLGAPDANHLIVSARTSGDTRDVRGVSLFLVPADAAGVTRHDYRLLDATPAADVELAGVTVAADALLGEEGGAVPLLEAAGDAATAALCAEAAGVMRRMLSDTVAYTKERKQFGQALASFQVLQHRLVDMFMAVEQAQSAAYLATLNLDADAATRARAVSAAKAVVAEGVRFVGQNAVQLHGAMGMTDELAVGHYFKRATVIEQQFGAADHHLKRYAGLADAA
jgi:alkylation response protein AidB-like acyl-CoA dehydrogenase